MPTSPWRGGATIPPSCSAATAAPSSQLSWSAMTAIAAGSITSPSILMAASAVMAAAEDWLRQAGIAKLQLLVRRENAQANAFYQSLGFEESTSVMFQKWLDGRDTTPSN